MKKLLRRGPGSGLIAVLCATAWGVTALLTSEPTLTLPSGTVLPPVGMTAKLQLPNGAPWNADALLALRWLDSAGRHHVSTRVVYPNATGLVSSTLYLDAAPETISFDVQFLAETSVNDLRIDRVFVDQALGQSAFHKAKPIKLDSGDGYDLSLGTLTMAPPPHVGALTISPSLVSNGQVAFEPIGGPEFDPLALQVGLLPLTAGTGYLDMYSWGNSNGWCVTLYTDTLAVTSHASKVVRRASQETLSGAFGATLSGSVNLSLYPRAGYVVLVTANEQVDPSNDVEVATFAIEFLSASRYGWISTASGDYGPFDLPAGIYFIELWGESASGDFSRYYSQQVTIAAGAQSFNFN